MGSMGYNSEEWSHSKYIYYRIRCVKKYSATKYYLTR